MRPCVALVGAVLCRAVFQEAEAQHRSGKALEDRQPGALIPIGAAPVERYAAEVERAANALE